MGDSRERNVLLSLCMIVRDEGESLERCLRSVRGIVDEIIVVDTGSTDNTVRVAEAFGAKILYFQWTGDFSAARNVSLDAATGDWILFLDADEELVEGDGPKILRAIEDGKCEGYYLNEINFVGDKPGIDVVISPAFRLFRNRPQHRFTGRLHEQVVAAVQRTNPNLGFTTARLNHYGYLKKLTVTKDKVNRNLGILEKEVQERPRDSFVHFNLGVEYLRLGRYEKALEAYKKSFAFLSTLESAYAPVLLRNITLCLRSLKRYEETLRVLDDSLKAFPDYTDLRFLRALTLIDMKSYGEAIGELLDCIRIGEAPAERYITQHGVGSYRAWLAYGDVQRKLGNHVSAMKAYQKALEAEQRFIPALKGLLELILSSKPMDVAEAIKPLVDETNPEALELVASLLSKSGYHELALKYAQLRHSLSADWTSYFLLGEVLLNTGAFERALEALNAIPDSWQRANQVALTKAMASLLLERWSEARGILEGLENHPEFGMHAAAYRSLLDRLEKGTEVHVLATSRQSEPILLDLLSSLLRLRAFDAFEAAVKLALDAFPDKGAFFAELSRIYESNGYPELAVEAAVRATDLGHYTADSMIVLGNAFREQGDLEAAISCYSDAIELDPTRVSAYVSLVRVYMKAKRIAEARKALSRAKKTFPGSEILEALGMAVEGVV